MEHGQRFAFSHTEIENHEINILTLKFIEMQTIFGMFMIKIYQIGTVFLFARPLEPFGLSFRCSMVLVLYPLYSMHFAGIHTSVNLRWS